MLRDAQQSRKRKSTSRTVIAWALHVFRSVLSGADWIRGLGSCFKILLTLERVNEIWGLVTYLRSFSRSVESQHHMISPVILCRYIGSSAQNPRAPGSHDTRARVVLQGREPGYDGGLRFY